MGHRAPQVDSYIEEAAEFARPMLKRLRRAFHRGCPEVEEAIKWGVPCFVYHGLLGGMAAFKQHVSVGFWKSPLLDDPANILQTRTASMSNSKFRTLKELPSEAVLAAYVAQAAQLNLVGTANPKPARVRVPPLPAALRIALEEHPLAKQTFDNFAPSHRREYIEWIAEAKREATRDRRIAQAIEWLAEGKSRNWKYESKC